MTASQSCKSARRACWLSISHGRARSDIQLSPQIVRQLMESDATRRFFTSRFIAGQLAGSVRARSHTSPAALKSP